MSVLQTIQVCMRPRIRNFLIGRFREASCAFGYKYAFQILKLHLGKGGLKPPVASPLLFNVSAIHQRSIHERQA